MSAFRFQKKIRDLILLHVRPKSKMSMKRWRELGNPPFVYADKFDKPAPPLPKEIYELLYE